MFALLIGFVASVIFSAAYSLYDRPLVLTHLRPLVSLFAIPCFPGLIVGMMATGNAHVGGGSLTFVLLVATSVNTLLYGALVYSGLAVLSRKR
jgi:hypothetical protein